MVVVPGWMATPVEERIALVEKLIDFYQTRTEEVLLAEIAETCHRFGMPLIAEMLPAANDKFQDPDWIGLAARAGYELGADIIKAYTTGTEADKRMISDCLLPFLAAGGPKSANPAEIASTAMAHGAAGVAFGRNVFGSDNPQQVVRDLVKAVHGA